MILSYHLLYFRPTSHVCAYISSSNALPTCCVWCCNRKGKSYLKGEITDLDPDYLTPLPPLPEVWSETANSYHLLPPGGNSSLPHINSLSPKPEASRLGSHLNVACVKTAVSTPVNDSHCFRVLSPCLETVI